MFTQIERFQVLGHLPAIGELRMHVRKVDFDHELHETQVVVARNRSVRTNNELVIDLEMV